MRWRIAVAVVRGPRSIVEKEASTERGPEFAPLPNLPELGLELLGIDPVPENRGRITGAFSQPGVGELLEAIRSEAGSSRQRLLGRQRSSD